MKPPLTLLTTLDLIFLTAIHPSDFIQIDNKQKISTTLKVCSENLAGLEFADQCEKVRLWDGGRLIPVEKTYDEAQIYSGAKLIVED